MDFDTAKENIQPLACGRNARVLEAVLSTDIQVHQEELLKQRKEHENAIHEYNGDDPLQPWYDYIAWIEQNYPSGGKESGLDEVLIKCLEIFANDSKYIQDRRMIKLYIKYIDAQPKPTEYYQELYNSGIGTMVADLYICWAYHYDLCNNFQQAESVFRKGLNAHAEPFDVLNEAHKHFGFTMSQRILHQDESTFKEEFLESMKERRFALTSLRSHRKKVGSVRTGSAVKSYKPGKISIEKNERSITATTSSNNKNISVQVFEDQNKNPNSEILDINNVDTTVRSQSLIKNIVDSARKQENMIEPGPWSKAKDRSQNVLGSGTVAGTSKNHSLGFEILEDDDKNNSKDIELKPIPLPHELNNFIKGIYLPKNHVSLNKPLAIWKVPVILETVSSSKALPMYNKFYLYPKPDHEYSLEELLAYRWCKKYNVKNTLTMRLDEHWLNDFNTGIRLFPTFRSKNEKLEEFKTDRYIPDESNENANKNFIIKFKEVYPENENKEFQFEEIMAKKWKKGERKLKFCPDETIMVEEDMEETRCGVFDPRRSMFISRKSLLTSNASRKSIIPSRKSVILPPTILESSQEINKSLLEPISKDIPNTEITALLNSSRKSVIMENPSNITHEEIIEIKNKDEIKKNENDLKNNENNLPLMAQNFKIFEDGEQDIDSYGENKLISPKTNVSFQYKQKNKENTEMLQNSQYCEENESPVFTSNEKKSNILAEKINEKFEIFEDDGTFQFKIPKPIVSGNICATSEGTSPVDTFFEQNETCSTQIFNLFIKSQSVSTPKQTNKISHCSSDANNVNAQKQITFDKENLNKSCEEIEKQSQINFQLLQQHKLSTIMETSEPTTASSGAGAITNTKSSISSPESESELSNVNFTSKSKITCSMKPVQSLQTIPEVSIGAKSVKTILPPTLKLAVEKSLPESKEDTIQSLMTSIKIFEDKTNTIPKTVFVPTTVGGIVETPSTIINSPPKLTSNLEMSIDKKEPFFGLMLKTPEKKSNFYNFESNQNCKTTKTSVSKPALNSSILSEFEDFALYTPKHLLKMDVSTTNLKDKDLKNNSKLPKFEDDLPNFSSVNVLDKIEPENYHPTFFSSNQNCPNTKPRISIFNNLFKDQELEFEEPIRTEAFLPNAKGLKNSTLIPQENLQQNENPSNVSKHHLLTNEKEQSFGNIEKNNAKKTFVKADTHANQTSFVKENSICITDKQLPNVGKNNYNANDIALNVSNNRRSILSRFTEIRRTQSNAVVTPTPSSQKITSFIDNGEPITSQQKIKENENIVNIENNSIGSDESKGEENNYFQERSIYTSSNLKATVTNRHAWKADDGEYDDNDKVIKTCSENKFVQPEIDLNETHGFIEKCLNEKYINPFDSELKEAFLNKIDFLGYLEKEVPTCVFVNKIPFLKKNFSMQVQDKHFEVQKVIGEGAFGTIYCIKEIEEDKLYALKLEKPANLWEYYICLELRTRIKFQEILPAFINVEYAIVGNNAGILISEYSKYGSLISICNKVKQNSGKNIDEIIVMILATQMLSIIDHLHSCKIIHADIKADNFLLTSKLHYNRKIPVLQLIDFGCAIDMEWFSPGQKFDFISKTKDFQCIEMRENRPWTFQIDLYGLASTLHVLLFGSYMDVEKRLGRWVQKKAIPRYMKKSLWQMVFDTLLNVHSCSTMPNLQNLKTSIEEEIEENEKIVRDKITLFNSFIES